MGNIMKDIPIPTVGLIVSFICLVFAFSKVNADDKIIGYTEHGIPITEAEAFRNDIKIPMRYIKGFSVKDNNVLIIKTKRWDDTEIDYSLYLSGCWGIDWTNKIAFEGFSPFYIDVGDRIVYEELPLRNHTFTMFTILGISVVENRDIG